MEATTRPFGICDAKPVEAITLSNANGVSVDITNYGATVISVRVPSKTTGPQEVTLCHRDLESLQKKGGAYVGCTVGRVANRIAKGTFELDGKTYSLPINNGANSLHGGLKGFDKVVWAPSIKVTADAAAVTFRYTAADGEEGYPGTLHVSATYSLTASNELRMEFAAEVEGKATPINLCNHAYWNLSGDLKDNVHDHVLQLNAPFYTPVDGTQIPTGEILPVAGTDFDFTSPSRVGDRVMRVDGGGKPGYDHNFARASDTKSNELPLAPIADLLEPKSGRRMVVSTTAPAVQLYTGNWLEEETNGGGAHAALCLETQNYPDAINKKGVFPNAILRPGEKYRHVAVHAFSW